MNTEIETLLQPISDIAPCGEDYSFSNDFHDIKKARTQDDPLLEMGDWVSERKQADWPFVAHKSTELLTQKSKDIRILTWLTEAWSHLYGFAGIAAGLELSYRMLAQYWQQIHPEIEDDDLDQRLGLLQGLTVQLPSLIKQVPLINSQPFYTLFDYEKLLHQHNNRLKNADESTLSSLSLELEQFDQSLFNTSKSFQFNNYQKFTDILNHWKQLKQVLDELMQLNAPSFAHIDSQLESAHNTLRKIYKADAFLPTADQNDMNSHPCAETISGDLLTTQPQGSVVNAYQDNFKPQPQNHLQNREQAMQVLKEIADYFQANEPHSPVSYMLQKTIKWGQIPLHEWLAQVIKNNDSNPLESVQELLGVKNNNESNEW